MIRHNSALQKKKKLQNKKQKAVNDAGSSYMSVHVLLADNFEGHQGHGLYNPDREQYRIFRIEKKMDLLKLLQVLAGTMKYTVEQIRPWSFCLHSRRPSPIDLERDLRRQVSDLSKNRNPWIIFLEVVSPDSELPKLPQFDKDADVLLFFKLYDPKNKRLHYCGHHYSSIHAKVEDLIPLLNECAGFSPDTPLSLYEEIESSEIEKIENLNDTLEWALEKTNDSVIIVFQKDTFKDADDLYTCEEFYRDLPHRVDVNFCDKTIRYDPGIDVTLSLQMNYKEVAEAVAQRVGTDQHFIQLFNCQKCKESPGNPIPCTFDGTLNQLIQCRKHGIHKKIFYCKLFIPVNELEERKTIKCTWFGKKSSEEKEITLYPSKRGTVSDLLEEAKKNLELSRSGSGKLRILEVKQRKIVSILNEDMQLENLKLRENKTFRIEEIPCDEINLAGEEQLAPVVQYFKTTTYPIAIPLLIKVKDKETFISVKRRILEKLEISDEEFAEFDVSVVADGKLKCCETSERVSTREFKWHHTQDNSMPMVYLGFHHLRENRLRYFSK